MMPVKARPGKFIPAQVVRKLRESALDDLAAEGQKLGMYSPLSMNETQVSNCQACPSCGLKMELKGQGYSDDLGCEVNLFHCDKCWTQKRVPVTNFAAECDCEVVDSPVRNESQMEIFNASKIRD